MPSFRSVARRSGSASLSATLFLGALWAFGALWFDFPWETGKRAVAVIFAATVVGALIKIHPRSRAKLGIAGTVIFIFGWWLTIPAQQYRDWKPEVGTLASAVIEGDDIVIQNVRDFDYRTETDFTVHYDSRHYDLRQLRGVDLFLTHWGSPIMAHPIASFDFGEQGHVCFSIETRPEKGEGFSAVGGFYRRFELICVAADERDIIRVRTNYRQGEEVSLYHFNATPEQARKSFLEYLATINRLHSRPRWYNAVTDNCTTGIRQQQTADERAPWDWRMLANGYMDRMLYDRGIFDQSLPFEELKRRSQINDKARAADQDPDFSKRIRKGLPGM